jgi:hypothetical protein
MPRSRRPRVEWGVPFRDVADPFGWFTNSAALRQSLVKHVHLSEGRDGGRWGLRCFPIVVARAILQSHDTAQLAPLGKSGREIYVRFSSIPLPLA